jgi:hypothetical protein
MRRTPPQGISEHGGQGVFCVLIADPSRGRPIRTGGICRVIWMGGNNHRIIHPDLTTVPTNVFHYCYHTSPCICTGCRERLAGAGVVLLSGLPGFYEGLQ